MAEMILIGFFTLAGVGLGGWAGAILARRAGQLAFEASEQAARQRADEGRQHLVAGVVSLLQMEMEHNLELVTQLFREVTRDLEGGRDEQAFLQRARFLAEPWPAWERLMWETQAHNLPLAFDADAVKHAYDVYTALDTLTQVRAALLAKLPPHVISDFTRWREEGKTGNAMPFEQMLFRPTVLHFNQETAELWQRANAIMSDLTKGRIAAASPARPAHTTRPPMRTLGQLATVRS